MHPFDLRDELVTPPVSPESMHPRQTRPLYRTRRPVPAPLADPVACLRTRPAAAPRTAYRLDADAPKPLAAASGRRASGGTRRHGTLNRWLGFSLAASALTVLLLLVLCGDPLSSAFASGPPHAPVVEQEPAPAALPNAAAPAATAAATRPEEVIREAEGAERVVAQRESDLVKSLKELDLILAQWAPGDLKQEGRALGQSKKIVQQLRTFADTLIRGHAEANKHFQLYRGALDRAPGKLTASVAVYEKYAATEPADFFKEQYLDMATKAKLIAVRFTARGQELAKVERDLSAKMEFVQRSRVFLDRMDAFLDLMSSGQGNGAEVQQYLDQLNRYMAQLETSIRGFKAITDKISTPSQPQ